MQTHREDFPLLSTTINGFPIAYLDNAATSQKPRAVIDAVTHFYEGQNANIHRGVYALAEEATALYEETRETVRCFINAASTEEIIFTPGATAGLNIVAQMMIENVLEPGDTVVLSESEHHANIVPWQIVGKRKGTSTKYIPVDEHGTLVGTQNLASLLDTQTKVLSIQCASNATGVVHPIRTLIAEAKKRGMITIVDAAQAVPHFPVDVQELGCDFLAFSGHKMFAPMGTGVLYGRKELLEKFEPILGGGDMIEIVGKDESTWAPLPHKFEPGTPNVAGVAGLKAAIEYIEKIGWETIMQQEDELLHYTWGKLSSLSSLTLHRPAPKEMENPLEFGNLSPTSIGDWNLEFSLPIFPFSLANAHPHDIATILDAHGVCIRAGHHCTQILHKTWNVPATCRASLSFYNTKEDVDRLVRGLQEAERMFA